MGEDMTQTDATWSVGGNAGVWIFRVLLVAATAFMVYSWFQPWWSSDVAVIQGTDDLVLHPWGVEAVGQVRMGADPALYQMPAFFTPLVWVYFGAAMLALAVSLFVNVSIPLGRIRLPLAAVLIILVGLSYLLAVGLAYWIGDMRAEAMDIKFIGRSQYTDPTSHRKIQMVSDLRDGYWYALYAGVTLVVLGLVRFLFVRKWRA
jgi:hypothetical protein